MSEPKRISYNWRRPDNQIYRYSVWIACVPYFGWSIVADYGKPGDECVVTSPHTREACIEHLERMYIDSYSLSTADLTIDETYEA